MATCLIGLGSNLGDSKRNLTAASAALEDWFEVSSVRKSEWIDTTPVGGPDGQGSFANGALQMETECPPREILNKLLEIESGLGRERRERWGPRIVDLDLLLYGREIIVEDGLVIPHPRMITRQFVLEPAAQVAPKMIHPQTGWTIEKLWNNLCQANYVVVSGVWNDETITAVEESANSTGCKLANNSQRTNGESDNKKQFSDSIDEEKDSDSEFLVEIVSSGKIRSEFNHLKHRAPNLIVCILRNHSDLEAHEIVQQEELSSEIQSNGVPYLFIRPSDPNRVRA